MTTPQLPGRLGTPDMELWDDPRADPRMIAAMQAMGMHEAEEVDVSADLTIDALIEYCNESEVGFEMMNDALMMGVAETPGVERSVEVIRGADGNDITLYIHKPAGASGAMPGIVHYHGGGMTILTAEGAGTKHWRDDLAATGMVVVGVEFRNAGGKLGPFPFPAGLNDCVSALEWTHENRDALGISKIVLSGESGGGNLTIATALKAKQDGNIAMVDGLYAMCPYVHGGYAAKDEALPSMWENDGYFLGCDMLGALAKVYDPAGDHATNPLAWPYHAATEELAGLPPTVISVNELDPLRDEGLAMFRKLLGAGVSAVSRTVNGTCHAGDMIFLQALPDVYAATKDDIKRFADSL